MKKAVIAVSIAIFMLVLPVFSHSFTAQSTASLSLSPATASVNSNAVFDVAVMVNTGGAMVVGVDAIINFDPAKLQVVSITPGSVFNSYPQQVHSSGVISISGIDATFNTPFSGTGTFATVRMRAIAPQATTATLSFQFTAGSTIDSNVTQMTTAQDILGGTSGATITIGSATAGSGVAQLPATGILDNNYLSIGLGAALISSGTLIYWRKSAMRTTQVD